MMNSTPNLTVSDDDKFCTLAASEPDVSLATLLDRAHAIGERAAGLAATADREHKLDDSIVAT